MSERVVTLTGNVGSTARNGMVVEGPQTLQPWSTFLGGGDDDESDDDASLFGGADEPEKDEDLFAFEGLGVQPFLASDDEGGEAVVDQPTQPVVSKPAVADDHVAMPEVAKPADTVTPEVTKPADTVMPEVTKPADAVAKPADAVAKPADAVAKPADAVAKPADAVTKPAGDESADGDKPAEALPVQVYDLKVMAEEPTSTQDAVGGAFEEDDSSGEDGGEDSATLWENVGGGWDLPKGGAEDTETGDVAPNPLSRFLVSENNNAVASLLESIAWSVKRMDEAIRESGARQAVRDDAIVKILDVIAQNLKQ